MGKRWGKFKCGKNGNWRPKFAKMPGVQFCPRANEWFKHMGNLVHGEPGNCTEEKLSELIQNMGYSPDNYDIKNVEKGHSPHKQLRVMCKRPINGVDGADWRDVKGYYAYLHDKNKARWGQYRCNGSKM